MHPDWSGSSLTSATSKAHCCRRLPENRPFRTRSPKPALRGVLRDGTCAVAPSGEARRATREPRSDPPLWDPAGLALRRPRRGPVPKSLVSGRAAGPPFCIAASWSGAPALAAESPADSRSRGSAAVRCIRTGCRRAGGSAGAPPRNGPDARFAPASARSVPQRPPPPWAPVAHLLSTCCAAMAFFVARPERAGAFPQETAAPQTRGLACASGFVTPSRHGMGECFKGA